MILACMLMCTGCGRVRDTFNRLRGDSHRLDHKQREALEWYTRVPTNRQDIALLRSMVESYQDLDDYTNLAAVSRRIYERTGDIDDLKNLLQVHLDYDADSNAVCVVRELIKADTNEWEYRRLLVDVIHSSPLSNQTDAAVAEIAATMPPSPSNLVRIASLWLDAGNHTNAIVLLEQALARDSTQHSWRLILAAAYGAAGRHDAALSNLYLIERAMPDDPRLLQLIGDIMTETGHADEAARRYRALLKADQDNALAMNNLAYRLLKHADSVNEGYELALSSVQRERTSYALDTLGYACYRRGHLDTALRYLNEAAEQIRINDLPAEPEIELHIGLIHASRGNVTAATPWLRQALAARPSLCDDLKKEACFDRVSSALGLENDQPAAPCGTNTLDSHDHAEHTH